MMLQVTLWIPLGRKWCARCIPFLCDLSRPTYLLNVFDVINITHVSMHRKGTRNKSRRLSWLSKLWAKHFIKVSNRLQVHDWYGFLQTMYVLLGQDVQLRAATLESAEINSPSSQVVWEMHSSVRWSSSSMYVVDGHAVHDRAACGMNINKSEMQLFMSASRITHHVQK